MTVWIWQWPAQTKVPSYSDQQDITDADDCGVQHRNTMVASPGTGGGQAPPETTDTP